MSRKAAGAVSPAPLPEVLLLGCEGVGKSCIGRQMKWREGEPDAYLAPAPTNGVERDELCYQQCSFVLKEIGGSMKSTWSSYFGSCAVLMFVLDVSNMLQLAESVFELASLLHNPALSSKAIVIVLNKIDAPGALSRSELQLSVRLDDLLSSPRGGAATSSSTDGRVVVLEVSAVKRTGVEQVQAQLVRALKEAK